MFRNLWVIKVRLMAAGDDHRRAVAGANICQCHQNIDLTTLEVSIVIAELCALDPRVPPRMEADSAAGTTYVREVLVNKQRRLVVVECSLTAEEMFHFINPRGMV